jgi:hypothetical protein
MSDFLEASISYYLRTPCPCDSSLPLGARQIVRVSPCYVSRFAIVEQLPHHISRWRTHSHMVVPTSLVWEVCHAAAEKALDLNACLAGESIYMW